MDAGTADAPGGLLYYIYNFWNKTRDLSSFNLFGVGAMTDFGPLIANPKVYF